MAKVIGVVKQSEVPREGFDHPVWSAFLALEPHEALVIECTDEADMDAILREFWQYNARQFQCGYRKSDDGTRLWLWKANVRGRAR